MADDPALLDADALLVPLADLFVHKLNTRSEPPAEDIALLADSIASTGLMCNLSGYADPDSPGQIGVVDGGRRLRALKLLATRDGRDLAQTRVPVKVTDDFDTARLWSITGNTARKAPHPADEVAAYRGMAMTGADPARIARAFGVTERHVRQRLKLAALPIEALDALRKGEIGLEQAGALTAAETADQVITALRTIRDDLAKGWAPLSPDAIRRTLAPDAVAATDRRAIYVGMANYVAEGGRIQADLFSDHVRLLDPAMLDRLFREKLGAVAAMFQDAGGWANVTALPGASMDYYAASKLDEVQRTPIDLPPADEDDYQTLSARSDTEELSQAEIDRLDDLEQRKRGDWTDADRERSTLFLWVDRRGDLQMRAFAPRHRDTGTSTGADDGTAPPKPETISAAVREDMLILRRLALQTALLDAPDLALDLLLISLTAPVYPWHRPLALSPAAQTLEPSKPDGTTVSDRLRGALGGDDTRRELHPADLAQTQAMGKKARSIALTAAIAALFCRTEGDFVDQLANLTQANVRNVWTPTAENWFSRLPVAMLDRIWADLVPPDRHPPETFAARKKADKARELGDLFNSPDYREALGLDRDTCARIDAWLPADLQFKAAAA